MRLASFVKKITVLLMLCLGLVSIVNASNNIESVRVWPAPENTRIVFDLSNKPDFKFFTLQSPQRLVIDFKNSRNLVDLMSVIKTDRRVKKFAPVAQNTKALLV